MHENTMSKSAKNRAIILNKARIIMKENLHDPKFSLESVASQLYISRRHLQRLFAQENSSYRLEISKMRMRKGALLIKGNPSITIEQVAHNVGYIDPSQFAKSFRREFSRTPREWRAQCRVKAEQERQIAA